MKIIIIAFVLWFFCGIISNLILRRNKIPVLYRILLFIEGFIGLLFIIIFKKGIKN